MSHIFVSYSRKDQDYAKKLADDLQARGFDVWMDDRSINLGEQWFEAIQQGIRDCSAFVIVMTPGAEQSKWVQDEILIARRQNKLILPLLLKGEKFDLLISVQEENVIGGSLPSARFYQRLQEVVSPKANESGVLVTPKPAAPPPSTAGRTINIRQEARDSRNVTQFGYVEGNVTIGGASSQDEPPKSPVPPTDDLNPPAGGTPSKGGPPESPTLSNRRQVLNKVLVVGLAVLSLWLLIRLSGDNAGVAVAGAALIVPFVALLFKGPFVAFVNSPTFGGTRVALALIGGNLIVGILLVLNMLPPPPPPTPTPIATIIARVPTTAAPTDTPSPEPTTATPPSLTSTPTFTATPTETSSYTSTTTPTPTPSLTSSATATRITEAPTTSETTLRLFHERDQLVLYVATDAPVSLADLQFRTVDVSVILADRFDMLRLTDGIAQPDSCLVLELVGTITPLPAVCSEPSRIFKVQVARADGFWFNDTLGLPRDIAIYRGDTLVRICPASLPDCPISYP